MTLANRNMLWATVIVDEFARSGVSQAVIAPGSRSTPLVMAIAADPRIRTYSIIDERSAAFFALGLALESGKPALLVCSSGTATANFYPAIVEAHYSNVPMIVITADRPHELRDSGANQTVDQVRMYGSHVLWSVDVAAPESNPSDVTMRSLRTLANRTVSMSIGPIGGPVHLNVPLRKPLEPAVVATDNTSLLGSPRDAGRPFTTLSRGVLTPTSEQLDELAALIGRARRGLVIAGPRTPQRGLADVLSRFSQKSGFPILADPLSNLRWSGARVIGAYDSFLGPTPLLDEADLIIHIGAMPASKVLEDYFVRNSVAQVVLITENGIWTDPYHRLSQLVHADPGLVFEGLLERAAGILDRDWAETWWVYEQQTWETIAEDLPQHFFDGGIVGTVADSVPSGSRIFVASSLPVRHLEQFARPDARTLRVYCNRGASGIDGTVSSAFGVAAAAESPVVLLTGDLALYHDMNGLLAASRSGAKVIVVVVNNDGGGIFRRLPIADFEPAFTELFLTPHGLDFGPAAELYGLRYYRADSYVELSAAFEAALQSDKSVIIEAKTDAEKDQQARAFILRRVAEALASIPA